MSIETQYIEFKSGFNEDVIESLTAFANTKGGGVWVGVNITFYNPGKPNTYQANARNKLLAEAFYLTGDIEKYGSGFRRIRNELEKYPTMKLQCEEIANGFLSTVSYTKQKIDTDKVPDEVPDFDSDCKPPKVN
jgi:predicted HTH transcriptional regulator